MRKVGVLLLIALLLVLVPAVLAGGWAVITLDDMPGEIRAGEPWTAGFTVLQHGQTPVHDLGADGGPIVPTLMATNPATGERVEAVATPTEEVGHFVVEVTFPSEGAWEWTIYPAPLMGETVFEPLNVLPAAAVVAPAAPVVEPVVVNEPVEAAAPAAADTSTTVDTSTAAVADSGSPTSVALRWGALIVGLVAVVLFAIQSRRRAQPVGAES